MKIKTIITGSTGMVGRGVLLECLDSADVDAVLVINRSPLGMQHPKLKELLVSDFFELSKIEEQLAGYNACFFCLGTSAVGKSEEEYRKTTYDLTLHFARTILRYNKELAFCYVSGTGTDSQENSRMMWARLKGMTENALLALPFKAAYMFRPGYIQPLRGTRTKVAAYNLMYILFKPLYPLLKQFPKYFTDTRAVGQAMINVVLKGYKKAHLETIDINLIIK